jgi:hypothetical protein
MRPLRVAIAGLALPRSIPTYRFLRRKSS